MHTASSSAAVFDDESRRGGSIHAYIGGYDERHDDGDGGGGRCLGGGIARSLDNREVVGRGRSNMAAEGNGEKEWWAKRVRAMLEWHALSRNSAVLRVGRWMRR